VTFARTRSALGDCRFWLQHSPGSRYGGAAGPDRPCVGSGVPRTSRIGSGEPGAAATAQRAETDNPAAASPDPRPAVWIGLAQVWRNWRTALVLVQPDTVVRWHRDWLRRRWTWRSTPRGRPTINRQVRRLVQEMAVANPLWGAPRIHGELRMLGLDVSVRTVSRLLRRFPRRPSQTWRTFLTNHLAAAVSMDFFTVPPLTGRVLFVLVLLSHQRRHIVHVNITAHPTATWCAQQVVEAFPHDTAPRWLHSDRDRIYGEAFRCRVASMGISEIISAPASPWQNPYVERLIGSMRRECPRSRDRPERGASPAHPRRLRPLRPPHSHPPQPPERQP
jgi:hypothetical protein